jgi:hypothetical protein
MVMDARLKAAERILDRGVRFRLPAPFFSRLFRLNRIEIKPLKAGTIMEFSRIVLKHQLEEAISLRNYDFLSKSIEPVARCLAVAVLNDRKKIEQRTDKLQKWLMWRVNPQLLIEMFLIVEPMTRTSDFMIITRYFVMQTLMMLNPNLGQEENGG